jgi:hypothetical protein
LSEIANAAAVFDIRSLLAVARFAQLLAKQHDLAFEDGCINVCDVVCGNVELALQRDLP